MRSLMAHEWGMTFITWVIVYSTCSHAVPAVQWLKHRFLDIWCLSFTKEKSTGTLYLNACTCIHSLFSLTSMIVTCHLRYSWNVGMYLCVLISLPNFGLTAWSTKHVVDIVDKNCIFSLVCCYTVSGFGNKEGSCCIPGANLTLLSSAQHYQQGESRRAEHQWRAYCLWGKLSPSSLLSLHSTVFMAVN